MMNPWTGRSDLGHLGDGMANGLESISRQYNVSWNSLLRVADSIWERHMAQLDEERTGPTELVALFGLSYILEQLEASWELNGLGRYRSARTTLRSSLEALFQLCAVARPDSAQKRRQIAIRILGQELSRKRKRLEQLHGRPESEAAFDPDTLASLEAELEERSRHFVEQFGVEPTGIPISRLAEMGGIGSHYFAYLEDKIFDSGASSSADGEGAKALAIVKDCCDIMLSALRAASRVLGEDFDDVLDSNQRRLAKLKSELEAAQPPSDKPETENRL